MADIRLAKEIGGDAVLLLIFVAHQEDRCKGPVNFFTSQLLDILGFAKWDRLDRARRGAIEAGWLNYTPGGNRKPGWYFVTVPEHLKDGGRNESEAAVSGPDDIPFRVSDVERNSEDSTPCDGDRQENCGDDFDIPSRALNGVSTGCQTAISTPANGHREGYPPSLNLNLPPSPVADPRIQKEEEIIRDDWKALADRLAAFGLADFQYCLTAARRTGCDVQHVLAILSHATAHRERWQSPQGVLHKRLSIARPGLAPAESWPKFKDEPKADAKPIGPNAQDLEYQRQEKAKSQLAEAQRVARESRFGAELDSMTEADLIALAGRKYTYPAMLKAWEREGRPRTGRFRNDLLHALDTESLTRPVAEPVA